MSFITFSPALGPKEEICQGVFRSKTRTPLSTSALLLALRACMLVTCCIRICNFGRHPACSSGCSGLKPLLLRTSAVGTENSKQWSVPWDNPIVRMLEAGEYFLAFEVTTPARSKTRDCFRLDGESGTRILVSWTPWYSSKILECATCAMPTPTGVLSSCARRDAWRSATHQNRDYCQALYMRVGQ